MYSYTVNSKDNVNMLITHTQHLQDDLGDSDSCYIK